MSSDAQEKLQPTGPGGKGRPTPKRRDAQQHRRAGPAAPPPKNRREAYRRNKDEQRAARAQRRAGMSRGEDKHLLGRDRGPVRRHVRDVVDTRRGALSFFLPSALVLFVGTLVPVPAVQSGALTLWFAAMIVMLGDAALLGRAAVKSARSRFPDASDRTRSLALYAIQRGTQIRRFRTPKPQVKVGQPV